MAVPVVAIVGRPNVGKSSLFNWLAGRRIAIVDPTAGVTRDRVSTLLPPRMHAGMNAISSWSTPAALASGMWTILTAEVEQQIQLAINQAHVVLFVTDTRTGPVPLDELVAERLRGLDKPVLCVVNKCDTPELEDQAGDFHRLGYEPVVAVSAMQNRGKNELFKHLLKRLPNVDDSDGPRRCGDEARHRRPPQYRQEHLHQCAGRKRAHHRQRGGRHDARQRRCSLRARRQGVHRHRHRRRPPQEEREGRHRVLQHGPRQRSIRRADVVLLFFDPPHGQPGRQAVGRVYARFPQAGIFVVNKWDLAKDRIFTGEFGDYLRKMFPQPGFACRSPSSRRRTAKTSTRC